MLSTTRVRLTGSDDDQIELFHGYRQQLVGCLLNSLHAKDNLIVNSYWQYPIMKADGHTVIRQKYLVLVECGVVAS